MDETLMKRVLPHSIEAEQSVIGSMLMDREAVIAASEIIVGSDFYQHQYGVMFDAMVELKNICTIYRLKKYYQMQPAHIKEHLISFTSRIPLSYYDKLLDADVSDDGDRILEHSRFRRYMDSGEWERDGNIENSTQRTMFRITRQYIHFSNSPALVFAAYMFLSELEIDNIIDIIEGLHYKLPPEDMDSMLIL